MTRMLRRAAPILALLGAAPGASAQPIQGFDTSIAAPAAWPVPVFYDVSPETGRRRPGAIIRAEPIRAPEGARAWRVIYVSRTWDGRAVPVSGLIIAPATPGRTPRPVIGWAHGTTGVARGCAPSLAPDPARNLVQRGLEGNPIDFGIPFLTDLIARGYVVTATDYYGLGGPGAHQYMVGATAARNLFDIARAARALKGINAGRELSLIGWSQGGQAVLLAGENAKADAPETTLTGIVALAPAATVMHEQVDQFFRSPAPHAYLFMRGYAAAYDVPLTLLSDRGRKLMALADKACVLELFKQMADSAEPGVTGDVTDSPAWVAALTRNQAGARRSIAPVLLVHGLADRIVLPEGSKRFESRARAAETPLEIDWIEGGDHRSILSSARERVLGWLDARHGATQK